MLTKQEKREELAHKKKIKQHKGASLAGQVSRTKSLRKYAGSINKMK